MGNIKKILEKYVSEKREITVKHKPSTVHF